MKVGIEKVLFVSVFWIIVTGISNPWYFIIFNVAMWVFMTSWSPCSCSLFWYNVGHPDSNCFSSLNAKHKSSMWWANFSGGKSLFGTWYGKICLTLWQGIVCPEINTLIFEVQEHSSWWSLIKLLSYLTGWYSQVLLDLFSTV